MFNWQVVPKNKDILNTSAAFEGMGLHLDANKVALKPKNCVEVHRYHPKFKDLEVTKGGKIDLNQFTMAGLKSRYDSKNYNITKDDKGNISVTQKDGRPVVDVINSWFGLIVRTQDKESERRISIAKNGEIDGYWIDEFKQNGVLLSKQYDKTNNIPSSVYEMYPNGSRSTTNYDKNGKITSKDFWKKGANIAETSIEYSDGKPYKKVNNGNVEYILVKDLVKNINGLGTPTTRSALTNNVLKRITGDNFVETMKEYEKQTGRELLLDIQDEIGLSQTLKNKLTNHIESLYCKNASAQESGEYLANKLFEDVQGLGSGNLAAHINMINSKNIKYVLVEYKTLAAIKTLDVALSVKEFSWKLQDYLNVDISSEQEDKLIKKLAPLEGLLTAIQGEWGIKQSERDKLIKKIIDISLEDKSGGVKSRIKRDMSTHPKDTHKLEIDALRAQNAVNDVGDLRNPGLSNKVQDTKKNQTFSGQIEQGRTGDCWLLAGLNSIIAKPKFFNELEKLVKIDSKTGDYFVTMKGANRTYRVSQNELKEYSGLATGSEKVNAVEIAMDKLIRDEAYKERGFVHFIDEKFGHVSSVTIDANWPTKIWSSLFGECSHVGEKIEPLTENFNSKDKLYGMSLSGEDDCRGMASSEKEKEYTITARHAYSIVGSDDKNIYLLNPWDSADKITISRENFNKLGARIQVYDFSDVKK